MALGSKTLRPHFLYHHVLRNRRLQGFVRVLHCKLCLSTKAHCCFSQTRNALTSAMNSLRLKETSPVLRAAHSNYCLQGGDIINAESYMRQQLQLGAVAFICTSRPSFHLHHWPLSSYASTREILVLLRGCSEPPDLRALTGFHFAHLEVSFSCSNNSFTT